VARRKPCAASRTRTAELAMTPLAPLAPQGAMTPLAPLAPQGAMTPLAPLAPQGLRHSA
jgi:hypothetical protein